MDFTPILIIVGLFVVMYFLMIRPEKKRERAAQEMRAALQVGDEVTTIGGIIGKVVSIKEETFVLETTRDRTKIRFLVTAIRSVDVKAEEAEPTRARVTTPAGTKPAAAPETAEAVDEAEETVAETTAEVVTDAPAEDTTDAPTEETTES
ncbi:MAG: preprotein translocase subunit YajC [Clostridia bacterium]|nr:preprotein translocase subunit YajC [Clostridia bacterium]